MRQESFAHSVIIAFASSGGLPTIWPPTQKEVENKKFCLMNKAKTHFYSVIIGIYIIYNNVIG